MYNIEEAKEASVKCLKCINKPCMIEGCPINTNIPGFIDEVKNDNYKEAYDILKSNNLFSHICSIVCPQEEQCEGHCVRGIKQTSVNIGKLERIVNEWAEEKNYKYVVNVKSSNGKSVAIIGSGPSSLECAYELIKEGFSVTVYEKENIAGGILAYGIPDFRLDKKLVKDIIAELEELGVIFVYGKELGKDIFVKELASKYDAVFVGIGAEKSTVYSLTDETLNENKIFNSDEFLKAYNSEKYIDSLGTVVVIGGGNVAMDSARAAVHMGAKNVKILYRRDKEHMPARKIELEEAIQDGVEFKECVRVISANVQNEKIVSLNCIKTEIINGKAIDIAESEFVENATEVVFAIGLKPNKELLEKEGIALDEWGMVNATLNGKTNIDNVFAGGDVVDNKATVCRAVAAGKRAAKSIIKMFEVE